MEPRTTLVLDEKENHDQSIKRFRSLCDMHRIPCGEAGNLRQFVTALKQDRHFAMDFWAMVGELSARERGTLSDDEMLATIVEGSSGKMISDLPLSDKVAAAELKNMLAGIDVDAPLIEETRDEAPVEASTEPPPTEVEPRPADAVLNREPPSAADVVQTKRSVEDALRRLEETSRELRDQLAALATVDQLTRENVSPNPAAVQTVPVAEEVVSAAEKNQSPAPTVEPTTLEASESNAAPSHEFEPLAAVEPVLTPRRRHRVIEERRTSASPQFNTLSHRGLTFRDADDDPTIPVPLSEYAEANSRRVGTGTIVLIFLLLLVVAAGYALHKGYGRDQVAEAKAVFLQKLGLFGEEVHDLATPSGHSANNPQPTPPPNPQPAVQQHPQVADHPQPIPQTPPQNPAVPQDNTTHPAPGSDVTFRAAPRPQPVPIQPGAVRVSYSAMQANLLSSRVAVYPESARTRGIQGPVEVEAVISTAGNVEYARAVSGDPHLRAAAEDAVMKWRFKPYLINGTPVQAITQVRINFRLR